MPDFKNVVRTLRAAERRNTVVGKKHPAWVTEFWWETKPPDGAHGVPIQRHARWVQTSLYSLWKQGASAAVWFQILDNPMDADGGGLQAGHFFYPEETAKPAFEAFRFPFVPDRVSNRKVNVWTIGPADGTVQIQQKRGNGFKTVDRMSVRDGVPEQTKVRLGGKPVMRGVLNGEASLTSKP